jgi:MtrB/PioB family decaheme-associated outer membrane protein
MKQTKRCLVAILSVTLCLLLASRSWAEVEVGDYRISGSVEVGGLTGHTSGNETKFDEYRQADPNNYIVPQLQLLIGSKKEDFYLSFDSQKPGYRDQNYRLRFGRYGLLDFEFEWDQIPHAFNIDNARTPYVMKGGTYTLRSRPTGDDAPTFSSWINDPNNTRPVDLELLNKIGKISIRYTPTPGWTFTGKYWSQQTEGKRAIAFPFGSGSSSNIAELAEPIDYQTHNIELGGEYAGQGWSLGLKYDGSYFHNSISTLVFDNPAAIGPGCTDFKTIDYTTGTGPCRGRADLYPSNQAHTFTLTGTASLPLMTKFLGTVSYGWRLQNDSFLPFTINACYKAGPCGDGLATMPTLSRGSLNGDIRPAMVNLTLVNNYVDRLNVKAYYRFYDLDNRTKSVSTTATVVNDQGDPGSDWTKMHSYQFSRNSAGLGAGYNFTPWLTGKVNSSWDRTHRSIPSIDAPNDTLNSDEYKVGPTLDIKPLSWLLFRASYQHSWRDDPGYHEDDNRKKFYLAKRDEDKASLFADISPWETLGFHAGFEWIGDDYPSTDIGVKNARNYSPSIGVFYTPLEWLKLFADYNFDWFSWNQDYDVDRHYRGKDKVHTFSVGSEMDLIKDVLGFRIQYGFSKAFSKIGNRLQGVGEDPSWPDTTNTWHELLMRLEYKLHKNVSMQLGYYFNMYRSKDFGVDIMKLWMGDVDTNSGQIRSVYLGDRGKGNYTAHIGFISLKLSF